MHLEFGWWWFSSYNEFAKRGESTLGFTKEAEHQFRVLENSFAHLHLGQGKKRPLKSVILKVEYMAS